MFSVFRLAFFISHSIDITVALKISVISTLVQPLKLQIFYILTIIGYTMEKPMLTFTSKSC